MNEDKLNLTGIPADGEELPAPDGHDAGELPPLAVEAERIPLEFVERIDTPDPLPEPAERRRASTGAKKKKGESQKMELYDWLQCVVGALLAAIAVFLFLGREVRVSGTSMLPGLHNGDWIITSRLLYEPNRGDVVVLQTDTFNGDLIIKRVIALAGQTVDIDFSEGIVYVDGVAQDEPFVNTPTNRRENFTGPVTVPEGCIFVLGDNRNESEDSRSSRVGMVDTRRIIGRAIFLVLPGEEANGSRQWSRFGSVR